MQLVPPKQSIIALLVLCSPCLATAAIPGCETIDNDMKRLACYDHLYRQNTYDPELSPREDEVGATPPSPPREKIDMAPFKSIVLKTNRKSREEVSWHLANGEVWRQTSFRYITIRDGQTVTVRRSLFGGFIMSNEKGAATRVKRVK